MVFSLSNGAHNGRWRDLGGFVCENGPVLFAVADNVISKWPPAALYGAGAGVLVVTRGPNSGARFLLGDQVIRAGRHPESDIFLDDITVSRRHVEITPTGTGYAVRDVGSLNGTYVNRERIDEVPLAPGDEVQIGKFKLVYLVAGNE